MATDIFRNVVFAIVVFAYSYFSFGVYYVSDWLLAVYEAPTVLNPFEKQLVCEHVLAFNAHH